MSRLNSKNTPPEGQSPQERYVLRYDVEPLSVYIEDPDPEDLTIALTQLEASLPPDIISMLIRSIQDGAELDRELMEQEAKASSALIEVFSTFNWDNDEPVVHRSISITAPTEELDEDPSKTNKPEDPCELEIRLETIGEDRTRLSLKWKDEDTIDSLNTLINRWEKFQNVFKAFGEEPIPALLHPFLKGSNTEGEERLQFKKLALTFLPAGVDARTVHTEQKRSAADHGDIFNLDMVLSGMSQLAKELAEIGVNLEAPEEAEEDEETSLDLLKPGDDIRIDNPTVEQISKISRLSSIPLNEPILSSVVEKILNKSMIVPEDFSNVGHTVKARIIVSYHHHYLVKGDLEESVQLNINEFAAKPTTINVSLLNRSSAVPGKADEIVAIFHWDQAVNNSEIRNWEQIIDVARGEQDKSGPDNT